MQFIYVQFVTADSVVTVEFTSIKTAHLAQAVKNIC